MKKISYQITIAAPKQKVWDTMLQPETYNEWTGAGWPGSFYRGEWKKGETIDFLSADGSGTRAKIEGVDAGNFIHSQHVAILLPGGQADTTSELAKNWVGITENYSFAECNGATSLTVDIYAAPQWEAMFNDGFPQALNKLKEMCER
jgi:hypothetical protein